jgi:predicted nucleic acid-binding protein
MTKFKAQLVVVDADVLGSAGGTEHPISQLSRQCLERIQKSSLKVALCQELQAEWRNHSSRLAIGWYAAMVKCCRIKDSVLTHPELDWDSISDMAIDQNSKQIAQKDEHLVRLALSVSDCRLIASNDDKSRRVFAQIHSNHIKQELVWIVPRKSSGDKMEELFNGHVDKPTSWHL